MEDVYTFRKSHLIIRFNADLNLHFCCDGNLPYLLLEPYWKEPKKKYRILGNLQGLVLEKVKIHPDDRLLRFSFSGDVKAVVKMFTPGANLYVFDSKEKFQESFKKTSHFPNPVFSEKKDSIAVKFLEFSKLNFTEFADNNSDKSLEQILKLYFKSFPKQLINQTEQLTSLNIKEKWISLKPEQKNVLPDSLEEFSQEMKKNLFYIYKQETPLFSLIPLKDIPVLKKHTDVFEASAAYIRLFHSLKGFGHRKREIMVRIQSEIKQLKRTIGVQSENLARFPDSETYREYADIIMAHLREIPSGTKSCRFPSLKDPSVIQEIPMNPELSPLENARSYYRLMKKYSTGKEELIRSLKANEERLSSLSQSLNTVTDIENPEDLRLWEKNNKDDSSVSKQSPKERKTSLPYYHLSFKGFDILIGKNSRDNMKLTFKHARKEDFWFHAYEIPGSHVIVRNPEKKESLPVEVFQKAAALAARYSQAKHSGTVPVIYTRVKYVSRIKNAPPGKVRYKNEKMLFVTPDPI